jgi:hypothetical protein
LREYSKLRLIGRLMLIKLEIYLVSLMIDTLLEWVNESGKRIEPYFPREKLHRKFKILRATGRIEGDGYNHMGDINLPLIRSRDMKLNQFLSCYGR